MGSTSVVSTPALQEESVKLPEGSVEKVVVSEGSLKEAPAAVGTDVGREGHSYSNRQ